MMSRSLIVVSFLVLLLGSAFLLTVKNSIDADTKISIEAIAPSSGPIATKVTLIGTGFSSSGNSLSINSVKKVLTKLKSADGSSLSFTFPSTLCRASEPCGQPVLKPGSYTIAVTNAASQTSNKLTFKVTDKTATSPAYFQFTAPAGSRPFTILLTDPTKIAEARAIIAQKTGKHVMGTVVKNPAAYNSSWSFQLEPSSIEFFEVAIEVCDAATDYVEQNLAAVGGAFLPGNRWCPWSSVLKAEVAGP